MTTNELDALRIELSIRAKNGIDFISSAFITWFLVFIIWYKNYELKDKVVITFIIGSIMLPLAFSLSKALKTQWKIKNNPLQPLGLWLNFAQLFYFPILIFIQIKYPEYFLMTYIIITSAHFFPYSWFYKNVWYAIFAGEISVGIFLLGLVLPVEKIFILPLFMCGNLLLLCGCLTYDYKKKIKLALHTDSLQIAHA